MSSMQIPWSKECCLYFKELNNWYLMGRRRRHLWYFVEGERVSLAMVHGASHQATEWACRRKSVRSFGFRCPPTCVLRGHVSRRPDNNMVITLSLHERESSRQLLRADERTTQIYRCGDFMIKIDFPSDIWQVWVFGDASHRFIVCVFVVVSRVWFSCDS